MAGHGVVVTGSSSGIGEATTRAFAALGAGVLVSSSRSVDAGEAVAASLPDALYVSGDIADPETPGRLVAAATATGVRNPNTPVASSTRPAYRPASRPVTIA